MLTVKFVVVCVRPDLPFYKSFARQIGDHNEVHESVSTAPLPLASGFRNKIRMSHKTNSLHHVPQLTVRIHRFGDSGDVTQRQFALLLDASLDYAHVTRDQRNLTRDVGDVADSSGLGVWSDVGGGPVRDTLHVESVTFVFDFTS